MDWLDLACCTWTCWTRICRTLTSCIWNLEFRLLDLDLLDLDSLDLDLLDLLDMDLLDLELMNLDLMAPKIYRS